MAPIPPMEPHIAVARQEGAGPDVFVNAHPTWKLPGNTVFGGFLLGHCVSAAHETIDPAMEAHSLQAVFLSIGDSRKPLVYKVERVADNRSFATRVVKCVQGEATVFIATVGYQKRASAGARTAPMLRYSVPMPDMGGLGPDEVAESSAAVQRDMQLRMGFTEYHIANGPFDPFEWRPLATERTAAADPSQFRLRAFIRAPKATTPPISGSAGGHGAHQAALAFLTDSWLLSFSSLACPEVIGERSENLTMRVTLNHAIQFHDAQAPVDEWMVMERESSWAAGGRILISQRVWSWRDGSLILSSTQEGLVRLRGEKASPPGSGVSGRTHL
ncbi:thioesterase-like superfamily-domain-containing protein [Xylariales sp. PMI_506]|nr:thioesterase-like superfamily-domain-containing protein [Xylariales sp. PMI_506]